MAGYQANKSKLESLGAHVMAVTADGRQATAAMAAEQGLTFPIGYGTTQEELAAFDPWWAEDQHGRYVQPMEFLVSREGVIFGSAYASGPIGRMSVTEVLTAIRGRERRRMEQAL